MSLLMDALKRAEEAKRQQAAQAGEPRVEAPADGGGLSLEPADGRLLPELSEHLAEVDAELRATAAEPARDPGKAPAGTPAAPVERERQAARNSFAAKAPAAAISSRKLLLIGGVGAALATAGAAYYYVQLSSVAASGLRPAAGIANAPAPATHVVAPQSPPPPMQSAAAPGAAATPPVAVWTPAAESPAPAPVREALSPARSDAAEPPVRVSTGMLRLNPAVGKGYQSLQAGDLRTARSAYEEALKADPRSVDALLGLAAIAAHEDDNERADALYWRALEADPKNAAAQAALLGAHAQSEPAQAESRLKGLLAAQSLESASSGVVLFALGNLYAREKRWNEAQAAYFQAYAADAGNPDYHFNLAVSLDHLGQSKLAAQFYRSALDTVANRSARFDRSLAQARLNELKP